MSMTISFPGGVAVDATFKGHTIRTDQPVPLGEDSAPSPFDLFLASIGTCMGFYALRFCQERNIATAGLSLGLEPVRDAAGKRVATMKIALQLPHGFPEKYKDAIQRAIDHCAVKRAMSEPPEFELSIQPADSLTVV